MGLDGLVSFSGRFFGGVEDSFDGDESRLHSCSGPDGSGDLGGTVTLMVDDLEEGLDTCVLLGAILSGSNTELEEDTLGIVFGFSVVPYPDIKRRYRHWCKAYLISARKLSSILL